MKLSQGIYFIHSIDVINYYCAYFLERKSRNCKNITIEKINSIHGNKDEFKK